MEAQSQEHLNWAGEITSLRKRWGCWGKWVALGFIEVTVLLWSQVVPWPALSFGLSVCEMGPLCLVLPSSLGCRGDPTKELHQRDSEEEGNDFRKPRSANAWKAKLVTRVLDPENEGVLSSSSDDSAPPTWHSEVQPTATKALTVKSSSKYGF